MFAFIVRQPHLLLRRGVNSSNQLLTMIYSYDLKVVIDLPPIHASIVCFDVNYDEELRQLVLPERYTISVIKT